MKKYIIATSKDWFHQAEKSNIFLDHEFITLHQKEELSIDFIKKINPRYIFFPHWSWIIPKEIYNHFECVCFHTAPLPFGRGGSPIQNLIKRNFQSAPVCALQVSKVLDGGPIYSQEEVSLLGSGDEIFSRVSHAIEKMILHLIQYEPKPTPQIGEPTVFKRRTPEESILPDNESLNDIYNHIRMLDAKGYPAAFIEYGGLRIEFKNAHLNPNGIDAHVFIKKSDGK